jgi:predicted metalloenzyme YecM
MAHYVSDFEKFVIIYRPYQYKTKKRMVLTNYGHAMSINLWNGRVYGIHKLTKKRILLKTVTN